MSTRSTTHSRAAIRAVALGLATGLSVAGLTACGSGSTTTAASTSAAAKTPATGNLLLRDPWVKAADAGMTALFGALENHGTKDVTLVSASTSASSMVQLHETVADGAGTKMQEKKGGFLVPAGGEHVLAPGKDHIMLMMLAGPLKAGASVDFTLTFSDGTTVKVAAPVRNYSAAQESYAPGATSGSGISMTPGMTMGSNG